MYNDFWMADQGFIKRVLYRSITLIIQDGKVIQIEKNEKIRLV
jgi:hypothetical protein